VSTAPHFRVHVFHYAGHGPRSWTWCREVNGEIYDYFEQLPRCDSHTDALAKALAWLRRKTEPTDAPSGPTRPA
jgi:hypothetical protein